MSKLHIEVVRKAESRLGSKALLSLIEEELNHRLTVIIGSKIETFVTESLDGHIDAIHICEQEEEAQSAPATDRGPGPGPGPGPCGVKSLLVNHRQSGMKLCYHVYRLCHDGASSEYIEGECGDTDQVAASFWTLPSADFHGFWDSLVFDSDVKQHLLQYAWTIVKFSNHRVDTNIITCNRIILLHGPPGTGKTTLCKAIAQKLSIRLSSVFDFTLLVEINAHSLFSKYFSESGKLVSKMFAKIQDIVSDPKTLVCVLIDEVESLSHSRTSAASKSEPSDAIRVVNALLTQLDALRRWPNVLVLCTSNITGCIDSAFVDRADIRQYIPNPSTFAIYTIYCSCLEELVRVGLVSGSPPPSFTNRHAFSEELNKAPQDSVFSSLVRLAEASQGLSGRTLRKIPFLAHAYHVRTEQPVDILNFIQLMKDTVAKSLADGTQPSTPTASPNPIPS